MSGAADDKFTDLCRRFRFEAGDRVDAVSRYDLALSGLGRGLAPIPTSMRPDEIAYFARTQLHWLVNRGFSDEVVKKAMRETYRLHIPSDRLLLSTAEFYARETVMRPAITIAKRS